jgi:hypothetical protein
MTRWRFGVMGPIGVGKDTVCAAVAAHASGGTVRHVKIGALVAGDLDRALTGGRQPDDAGERLGEVRDLLAAAGVASVRELPDPGARREILQWWGALRREGSPAYWVDRLADVLDTADDAEVVYVSDVRTDAEIDLLRGRRFLVVELVAPRHVLDHRTGARDGTPTTVDTRASDEWTAFAAGHPKADLVVPNTGDPATAAGAIVAELVGREVPTGGGR